MPDPVKTQLLKAVKTALEGITVDSVALFKTVIRNPSKPIDRETAVFPICFIYDNPAPPVRRNRLAMVEMPLQIEAWVQTHELSISDQADIIEAEVHKALLSNASIIAISMGFWPDPNNGPDKFIDDEFTGGIILPYITKFAWAWNDPYNPVRAE